MAGPLLVLDTATLYYRSYFALPESMVAPDGFPHNAVRGVLSTIGRLREMYQPRGIVAAWDNDWRPQWRVDLLPSYKAHRLESEEQADEVIPDTLGPQITALRQILGAGGVPVVGADPFEADDVIATLAATEHDVIVVSGDRDLVQVVRDDVQMLLLTNGGMDKWPLLNADAVTERFGVPADAYVDLAVLRGDPSDGLPGVRGIGEKTATALLQRWGSLAQIYEAISQGDLERPLTPRLAENLVQARTYVETATIVSTARTDVPLQPWHVVQASQKDPVQLTTLVHEWGVEKFMRPALEA